MQTRMITPVRREACDGHTRELMEMMTNMFDVHLTNRGEIDDLLGRLRETEAKLHDALLSDAEGKANLGQRKLEADKKTEVQEKKITQLEDELKQLEAQREEKEKTLRKYEADLQGVQARVAQTGASTHDAEVLLQQLQALEEREKHLRKLENRLICCEDLKAEGTKTLTALLKEHDELGQIQGTYYQSVHVQMADNQVVADTLTQQLKELVDRKQEMVSTKKTAVETKQERERYYQELADVKGVLEADLRKAQNNLARSEQELTAHMDSLLGPYADPERLIEKLEETMMLLKAASINLNADHAFIGEINEKASNVGFDDFEARGYQSFCDAFKYIRGQVEVQHGAQQEAERWTLRGEEVAYEAVEPLLSALKQLVTCYDMMSDFAKDQVPYAHEIVRNSTHLLNLVHETTIKYQEIERAREEEASHIEKAKEQKKQERLAKKYAPRSRDPYSRAPAMGNEKRK